MGRARSTNGGWGGEEKEHTWDMVVGKRPLLRPRHKWMDNIKTDLKEIGWGGMDWIHLARDRRLL
jgi:hypothetical protein